MMIENATPAPEIEPVSFSLKSVSPEVLIFLFMILLPVIGFYFGTRYSGDKKEVSSASQLKLEKPTTTPTPQQTFSKCTNFPSEIDDTTLYFQKEDGLYKLSPLGSTPTVFLNKIHSFSEFSPTGDRVAYITGKTDGIVILNLINNDKVIIPNDKSWPWRGIDWSPSGKFILVDAGTGPEGTFTAYDTVTGKELGSFSDGGFKWYDERTIFIAYRTSVEPLRPAGAGDGLSIAKIDIVSGEIDFLIKADALNDYDVIKVEDNCLYYTRDQAEKQSDWYEATKKNHFCYDLKTKSIKMVPDSEIETEESILRSKIVNIFPEHNIINKSETHRILQHPNHSDWVIMGIYSGNSVYKTDIVMFNLNNPKETFCQIDTGALISWF